MVGKSAKKSAQKTLNSSTALVILGIFRYFGVLLGILRYFWVLLDTLKYFKAQCGTFKHF